MDPAQILDSLRSIIVVVATDGTILDAYGSIEEHGGMTRAELVGTNMLDRVVPEALPDMLDVVEGSAGGRVRRHPIPLMLPLLHREGHTVLMDALVTGVDGAWVVQLTPRSLNSNALDLIDLVLDGVDLVEIATAVAERHRSLAHAADGRHSCHVVLDAGTPEASVRSAGDDTESLDEAILAMVTSPDSPLLAAIPIDTGLMGLVDELPASLGVVAKACGFEAAVASRVGDEDSTQWILIWFYSDPVAGQVGRGSVLWRQSLLRVVSAALSRKRFEELMVAAARTDPLTRLVNRAGFNEAMARLVPGDEAAVLYMDLDHFKPINDHYGHPVGDAVLIEVARRIERSCRPEDVVARLGGDEFAVLITGPGSRSTGATVRRIEAAVGRTLEGQIGPPKVGVTIGVASTTETPLGLLVATADERLLEQKRSRSEAGLPDARGARRR